RVLLVEHNSTQRRILQEMLGNWRIEVALAENGASALELLSQARQQQRPFTLAVLDTGLPGEDSFALLERIQELRSLGPMDVVLLTAAGQALRPSERERAGSAPCVAKPVRQSDLFDAITTVLGERLSRESGRVSTRRRASRKPTGALRILVAEDNPVNQKLAVRLLEKRGHTVEVANNGSEALEALGKKPFDLVLMDVQMPEMGGLEATARIREKERQAGGHIPIVAMTAHAMKGDRERCLEAGMDGYVSKPVRKNDLFEAIEAAVSADQKPADTMEPDREPAALDFEEVLDQLGGDKELLRELVELFLKNSPKTLATLRTGVQTRSARDVQAAAHSLKGTLGHLAAREAVATAEELESRGREGNLEGTEQMLQRLERQIGETQRQLAAFLRDGKRPSKRSEMARAGRSRRH
ncbi:MAG: response regulator, partial [Terriglobales bacterium]